MQAPTPQSNLGLDLDRIFDLIKYVVNTLIIPYGVYLVKRMDRQDEKLIALDKKMTEVNTTLVGQDGQNGLRSRFGGLERMVNELRVGFARHLGIEVRDTPRE